MNPTKLVLHFSDFFMIFYAIYKKQPKHFYYLSYPFAVRPLKRFFLLQCSPWAAGQRWSGQILANRRPGPAGHGRGRGLGSLGTDSHAQSQRGKGRRGGRRQPGRGSRGGRPVPVRAAWEGLVNGWRALVDAREGGEGLGSVHIRPEVVARRGGSGGGHGWSAGARLGVMQGAVPLLWATRDRRRRP
jgi:hypothetical protein